MNALASLMQIMSLSRVPPIMSVRSNLDSGIFEYSQHSAISTNVEIMFEFIIENLFHSFEVSYQQGSDAMVQLESTEVVNMSQVSVEITKVEDVTFKINASTTSATLPEVSYIVDKDSIYDVTPVFSQLEDVSAVVNYNLFETDNNEESHQVSTLTVTFESILGHDVTVKYTQNNAGINAEPVTKIATVTGSSAESNQVTAKFALAYKTPVTFELSAVAVRNNEEVPGTFDHQDLTSLSVQDITPVLPVLLNVAKPANEGTFSLPQGKLVEYNRFSVKKRNLNLNFAYSLTGILSSFVVSYEQLVGTELLVLSVRVEAPISGTEIQLFDVSPQSMNAMHFTITATDANGVNQQLTVPNAELEITSSEIYDSAADVLPTMLAWTDSRLYTAETGNRIAIVQNTSPQLAPTQTVSFSELDINASEFSTDASAAVNEAVGKYLDGRGIDDQHFGFTYLDEFNATGSYATIHRPAHYVNWVGLKVGSDHLQQHNNDPKKTRKTASSGGGWEAYYLVDYGTHWLIQMGTDGPRFHMPHSTRLAGTTWSGGDGNGGLLYFLGIGWMYIYAVGGDTVQHLSVTASSDVTFAASDDETGKQRWIFEQSETEGWYTIEISGGISEVDSNLRKYLSVGQDTGKAPYVNMWHADDGSGRQRWLLKKGDGDWYNIEIVGGVSGGYKFLSTDENGSFILSDVDDGTGKQRWNVTYGQLTGVSKSKAMQFKRDGNYLSPIYSYYVAHKQDIPRSIPDFTAASDLVDFGALMKYNTYTGHSNTITLTFVSDVEEWFSSFSVSYKALSASSTSSFASARVPIVDDISGKQIEVSGIFLNEGPGVEIQITATGANSITDTQTYTYDTRPDFVAGQLKWTGGRLFTEEPEGSGSTVEIVPNSSSRLQPTQTVSFSDLEINASEFSTDASAAVKKAVAQYLDGLGIDDQHLGFTYQNEFNAEGSYATIHRPAHYVNWVGLKVGNHHLQQHNSDHKKTQTTSSSEGGWEAYYLVDYGTHWLIQMGTDGPRFHMPHRTRLAGTTWSGGDGSGGSLYFLGKGSKICDSMMGSYLSVNASSVTLANMPSDGNEQSWALAKDATADWYSIISLHTNNYLSVDEDSNVILSDADDGTGRQRWVLNETEPDSFGVVFSAIEISGGVIGSSKYLSLSQDFSSLTLSDTDANGMWVVEDAKLTGVRKESAMHFHRNGNYLIPVHTYLTGTVKISEMQFPSSETDKFFHHNTLPRNVGKLWFQKSTSGTRNAYGRHMLIPVVIIGTSRPPPETTHHVFHLVEKMNVHVSNQHITITGIEHTYDLSVEIPQAIQVFEKMVIAIYFNLWIAAEHYPDGAADKFDITFFVRGMHRADVHRIPDPDSGEQLDAYALLNSDGSGDTKNKLWQTNSQIQNATAPYYSTPHANSKAELWALKSNYDYTDFQHNVHSSNTAVYWQHANDGNRSIWDSYTHDVGNPHYQYLENRDMDIWSRTPSAAKHISQISQQERIKSFIENHWMPRYQVSDSDPDVLEFEPSTSSYEYPGQ